MARAIEVKDYNDEKLKGRKRVSEPSHNHV